MCDWMPLLVAEVARTSITASAARLGYSRTSISLVLAGKYPGGTDNLAARVLEVFGAIDCPHLGLPVTRARCAASSGKMPTSSPGDLRLWRACQTCPHRPAIPTKQQHRPEAVGKEHAA